jgi:hypothetical protein
MGKIRLSLRRLKGRRCDFRHVKGICLSYFRVGPFKPSIYLVRLACPGCQDAPRDQLPEPDFDLALGRARPRVRALDRACAGARVRALRASDYTKHPEFRVYNSQIGDLPVDMPKRN